MTAATPLRPRAVPADGLLHPFALGALAVLLLNDHVLKAAAPGWWTGKLSDVAGLVVLALVLQAFAELAGAPISRRVLVVALFLSAATLTTINLLPAAGELYRWSLGTALAMPAAAGALLAGQAPTDVVPVALVRDPTDLLALPVLAVTYLVYQARVRAW